MQVVQFMVNVLEPAIDKIQRDIIETNPKNIHTLDALRKEFTGYLDYQYQMEQYLKREDAIAALICKGTLPPQIDYIPSEKWAEWAKAEKLIENDTDAMQRVEEAINEYYESGVAEMDANF